MDKKLKQIIQPGYHFYFAIFLVFSLSCAYVSYVMSGIGIVVCLLMYLVYRHREKRRRSEMMRYLQSVTLDAGQTTRSSIIDFPLPTVIVRASTNETLWANDAFCEVTGRWDCAPNVKFSRFGARFQYPLAGRRQAAISGGIADRPEFLLGVWQPDDRTRGR